MIIQQLQIQVVEGKFTTIIGFNVNLERKEALVFDIDGGFQRQDAITFITIITDGFRILIECVPAKDLFFIRPGIWPGVISLLENVGIVIWGCGFNSACLQIHHLGVSIACIRVSGFFFSIMGCLVLDGEVEDFPACKAFFEVIVSNVAQIDLFLNLQLVIIREVERHRHVGFPHTTFHVVHGKGVLFVFVEWFKICFLRVEINVLAIIFHGLDMGTAFFIYISICCRSAFFDPTDIGCYTIFLYSLFCFYFAKFQQAGNLTMGAANVKRQLAINEYPNVIVTGEEELDAGFFRCSICLFCFHHAVIRQGKIHLQLGAKAVIVGRKHTRGCCFIEREVAIRVFRVRWRTHIL